MGAISWELDKRAWPPKYFLAFPPNNILDKLKKVIYDLFAIETGTV